MGLIKGVCTCRLVTFKKCSWRLADLITCECQLTIKTEVPVKGCHLPSWISLIGGGYQLSISVMGQEKNFRWWFLLVKWHLASWAKSGVSGFRTTFGNNLFFALLHGTESQRPFQLHTMKLVSFKIKLKWSSRKGESRVHPILLGSSSVCPKEMCNLNSACFCMGMNNCFCRFA